MKTHSRFTLVELLVVFIIIIVLIALLAPVIIQAKVRSREVACINNIRNLAMGIQLYYNEHDAYPHDQYLDLALKGIYAPGKKAFECPSTRQPYDMFYVPRAADESDNYFIGCPYHHVVNFGPGQGTEIVEEAPLLWNGKTVYPGQELRAGTLTLADGSTVQIRGRAMVLASYHRKQDTRLRTFIRIFEDYVPAGVHSTVTPGARFEVVTPAAIAGVQGTVFDVAASIAHGGADVCTVTVAKGTVVLKGPYVDTPKSVSAGESATTRTSRHTINDKKENKGADGNWWDHSWWPPWG